MQDADMRSVPSGSCLDRLRAIIQLNTPSFDNRSADKRMGWHRTVDEDTDPDVHFNRAIGVGHPCLDD
eukprot:7541047-Heterocapsa_arctica.AAC.1